MKDPVFTIYGHVFERTAIEDWIKMKGTCPLTNKPLTLRDVIPAFTVKNAIEEYKRLHKNSKSE